MLNLDYRDAWPIYEQVRDGLRRLDGHRRDPRGEAPLGARPGPAVWPSTPTPSSGRMSPWRRRAMSAPSGGGLLRRAPHRGGPGAAGQSAGPFDTVTAELLYLGVTGEAAHRPGAGNGRRGLTMIQVNNVVKSFDGFRALDGLTMSVPRGLHLRPGGAQRRGQVHPFCGTSPASTGRTPAPCGWTVNPVYENPAVKSRMAWIPDELYYFLSASTRDMMKFYRGLYPQFGDKRYQALKDAFPAVRTEAAHPPPVQGDAEAVRLLAGLCCMPDILVLDEPVDGLDPVMRRQVWSLLMGWRGPAGDHGAGLLPQPAGAGGCATMWASSPTGRCSWSELPSPASRTIS